MVIKKKKYGKAIILFGCLCGICYPSFTQIGQTAVLTCKVIQYKDTAVVEFPKNVSLVHGNYTQNIIDECKGKNALQIVNYLATWKWRTKGFYDNTYILEHEIDRGTLNFKRDYDFLKNAEKLYENR